MDLIRPEIPKIWRSFSVQDRKRFLRHVVRYWDVHRHRVDPRIGEIIAKAEREGRLKIVKGRASKIAINQFQAVFDCTGFTPDLLTCGSPLIQSLIVQGKLVLNNPALGAESGCENLFLIGPLLRGRDWESIAIPELRKQAEQIAIFCSQD
jgi:uncharacterized NAD(P)/FAD-binding protein YdhS